MIKALVPLADGCEEMEAVIIIDIFRRAGWRVIAAATGGDMVHASRGVRILPDCRLDDVNEPDFDVIAIPGGIDGAKALARDERVLKTIREHAARGKMLAAICAGPLVLQAAGLLRGRKATCHPGVADQMAEPEVSHDRVVNDGNIVTSQGPGTAMEFALAIVAALDGEDAASAIETGLVLRS